jgi:hypothetical protein
MTLEMNPYKLSVLSVDVGSKLNEWGIIKIDT